MKRLFTLSVLFAALFTILVTNNSAIAQSGPASFTKDFVMKSEYIPVDGWENEYHTCNVQVVYDSSTKKITIKDFFNNPGITNLNTLFKHFNFESNVGSWNDEGTIGTFTFPTRKVGYTSSYSSYHYVWVVNWKQNPNIPSSWSWDSNSYSMTVIIDLNNDSMSMNKWSVCITTGEMGGGSSTPIVRFNGSTFYVPKTDLVDIVNDGTVGEEYTVNDDLVGVKVVDNMLFAKDLGKYKYPSEINNGQIDFLGKTAAEYMGNTRLQPVANFDQSNWVMLTGLNNPSQFVGNLIKGKSIKGTLVDKVNPTIAVSSNPEQGDQYGYEPNLYIMPSFNEDYYAPTSNFFFVAPKAQEYAYITWACYNDADGNFYTMSDGNTSNLTGGVKVNWDYYPDGNPQDGYVYEFDAIVRKVASTTNGAPLLKDGNQSTPVTGVLSDDYMVYPLRLYDVPTAINSVEVAGKVVNVKYYNLMGVESSTPFDGVNIVVTTYDNGSRITSKKLY